MLLLPQTAAAGSNVIRVCFGSLFSVFENMSCLSWWVARMFLVVTRSGLFVCNVLRFALPVASPPGGRTSLRVFVLPQARVFLSSPLWASLARLFAIFFGVFIVLIHFFGPFFLFLYFLSFLSLLSFCLSFFLPFQCTWVAGVRIYIALVIPRTMAWDCVVYSFCSILV